MKTLTKTLIATGVVLGVAAFAVPAVVHAQGGFGDCGDGRGYHSRMNMQDNPEMQAQMEQMQAMRQEMKTQKQAMRDKHQGELTALLAKMPNELKAEYNTMMQAHQAEKETFRNQMQSQRETMQKQMMEQRGMRKGQKGSGGLPLELPLN